MTKKTLIEPPAESSSYEEVYAERLRVFRDVHTSPNGTTTIRPWVHASPLYSTWLPLLWYLGHGDDDDYDYRREEIEHLCSLRPEMVDALWRADMRDKGTTRHRQEGEFRIATYSGFFRPEILDYIARCRAAPQLTNNRNLILVPCTADKPYPSKLHVGVEYALRNAKPWGGWDIAAVSTAVGIAPKHLWHLMPQYDNGLPLFDRLAETVPYFMLGTRYARVINYTDMLQHDLYDVLSGCRTQATERVTVTTPIPFPRRCDYRDLLKPEHLEELVRCVS